MRELAELGLVEISDRIDAAGHVAELCAVPEEQLRLVARAEDDPVRPGPVVLDALPLARHLVADAHPVDLLLQSTEIRVDLFGDRDFLETEAEHSRQLARVIARLTGRASVWSEQPEHILRAKSDRRE